jgi:hypothetical protein
VKLRRGYLFLDGYARGLPCEGGELHVKEHNVELIVTTREYTVADYLKRVLVDAGFTVDDESFERVAQQLLQEDRWISNPW